MKSFKNISRLIILLITLSLLVACSKNEKRKTESAEEEKILEKVERAKAKKKEAKAEKNEDQLKEKEDGEVKFEDLYGIWTCIRLPAEYNSEEFVEEFRIRIDQKNFHFYSYETSFINFGPYVILDSDPETKTFTIKVREETLASLDYFNENPDYFYDEENFKNFQVGETYEEAEEIQIFFDQEYKLQLLDDSNLSLQLDDEGPFIFEFHHSLDEGEFY